MNILNLEPRDYSTHAINLLNELGVVLSYNDSVHNLDDMIREADVIITRLGFQINKEFIDKSPNLKYILTATTGLDHIDLEYAENNLVKVLSLNGETEFLNNVHATAEHTWALFCLLYTSPSPRDRQKSRMPSSA